MYLPEGIVESDSNSGSFVYTQEANDMSNLTITKSQMVLVNMLKLPRANGVDTQIRHTPNGDEHDDTSLDNVKTLMSINCGYTSTLRFTLPEIQQLREYCEAVLMAHGAE